jgi:hypothetical protein
MNEDGRPDAEELHERAHDALAVALNAAPEVRKAIRRWVDTWLADNPHGEQGFERMRAMAVVWQLIEDQRDRDERADPNDPQGPWAGTVS